MTSAATKESVARSLRRLRAERRLKQSDVANAIGVTSQAISQWERAVSQPTSDKLWALADFFGVSVAEVMGKVEVTTREIIAVPSSNEEE